MGREKNGGDGLGSQLNAPGLFASPNYKPRVRPQSRAIPKEVIGQTALLVSRR